MSEPHDPTLRAELEQLARLGDATLSAQQLDQLCEAYVYLEAMLGRIPRDRPWQDEPMNTFRFPKRGDER
ncbi:MAG: hypothetical protein HY423_01050 [Candidatus Lambdaproteobacteria bacterium]|nr:hypothetical protein [Candidatus Lambdaproteobacteria bacterium]